VKSDGGKGGGRCLRRFASFSCRVYLKEKKQERNCQKALSKFYTAT